MNKQKKEQLAIIGMGCRFPGACNVEAFWELLRNGVDAISVVPASRWNIDEHYPECSEQVKMKSNWGGFLRQEWIEQFNPQFFGISAPEARVLDPQQRLLLEVTWEAIESAGLAPEQLKQSNTGVFVGICANDYFKLGASLSIYSSTGNAFSIAANRLSYFLDLRGPSLAIDTACSSSLVAVHQACQALRLGDCDLAFVGGVNVILDPDLSIIFSEAQMLASDGRCKTFDAKADGYVRGEGCGVIIIKLLEKACQDNDNILAVIEGSAINQDGRSNGLTAPNGLAQQALIKQALTSAALLPEQIGYIETHGTGTSLGDPIEVNALKQVMMKNRSLLQPCWLGSVKTNIGHLEGAAGIAGLIKTVLCLQHEEIPPNLHFHTLNPYIDLKNTSLSIPTKIEKWERGEQKRFAGVSSFGFGGTNAHLIIGEAPIKKELNHEINGEAGQTSERVRERSVHICTLSGNTHQALLDLAYKYLEFFKANPKVALADICFTANSGRAHLAHRLALIADSRQQLSEQLQALLLGKEVSGLLKGQAKGKSRAKIAFLFTGQGSQYPGMGKELYETQPTFQKALARCAAILDQYLEKPLLDVLFSGAANLEINETAYTQPALFALEYALFELWKSWGIEPDAVMGHSVGEYVAACAAGVFSLSDGLKLVAARGRLIQELPKNGAMLSLVASEEQVLEALKPYAKEVSIAAINGSKSLVVSGKSEAVEAICSNFQKQGIKTKALQVSHAFHSSLMEPMLAKFEQVLGQVTFNEPNLNLISNLTGKPIAEEIAAPEYWLKHTRETVRFQTGMETLAKEDYQVFVECGPQPVLLGMGRTILPEHKGLWLPSLRANKGDWQQLLRSLAELYLEGIKIDWSGLDCPRQKVVLPTYPWQRQRYWIEAIKKRQVAPGAANDDGLMLYEEPSYAAPLKDKEVSEEEFLEFIKSRLPETISNNILLDTPFQSLGLDSLALLSLRQEIQVKLNVDINWSMFLADSTPRVIIQNIKQQAISQSKKGKDKSSSNIKLGEDGFEDPTGDISKWYELPYKNELPIIVIITTLRHGSSLTSFILNAHPNLFAPQGLYLLPYANLREREEGLKRQPLFLEEGLAMTVQELWGTTREGAREIIKEWTEQNLPIQKVYQNLQSKCAPRILIDRGTIYGFNIEVLRRAEKIFENAKYIHLVRHPYTVLRSGTSMVKKTMMLRNMIRSFDDAAADEFLHKQIDKLWSITHANSLRFFDEIGSKKGLRMKFEDLVANPKKTLTEVCAFLEIPFEKAMMNPYAIEDNVRMHNKTGEAGISARDPKLMQKNQIDAGGAAVGSSQIPNWQLSPNTEHLSVSFGYLLPTRKDADATDVMVKLNAAASGAPVFFIPGAGGNIQPFFNIGKALEAIKRPAFALQIPDYAPLDSLESLTAFFVHSILNKSDKLCCVVGYSAGVGVAWEIARQLTQKGIAVKNLLMVDRDPFDTSSIRGLPDEWAKITDNEVDLIALLSLGVENGLSPEKSKELLARLTAEQAEGVNLEALFQDFISPIKVEAASISAYKQRHTQQRAMLKNFKPNKLEKSVNKVLITAEESGKIAAHDGIKIMEISNCNHFTIWRTQQLEDIMMELLFIKECREQNGK